MWFSGEQLGIEMAQRGKAALPGLRVLVLVSEYLVFFFKPQLLEFSNKRKIHQLPCKKQWLWERNLKVCFKYC